MFRRAVDRPSGHAVVDCTHARFRRLCYSGDAATAADGPLLVRTSVSALCVPGAGRRRSRRSHAIRLGLGRGHAAGRCGDRRRSAAIVSKPLHDVAEIDPGCRLRSRLRHRGAAWKEYAEGPDCWCDAGRRLTWAGCWRSRFGHRLMDGDALAVILGFPAAALHLKSRGRSHLCRHKSHFLVTSGGFVWGGKIRSRKRNPRWAETRFQCGCYDERKGPNQGTDRDHSARQIGPSTFVPTDVAASSSVRSRGKDVVAEFSATFRPAFWVSDRFGATQGSSTLLIGRTLCGEEPDLQEIQHHLNRSTFCVGRSDECVPHACQKRNGSRSRLLAGFVDELVIQCDAPAVKSEDIWMRTFNNSLGPGWSVSISSESSQYPVPG